MRRPRSMRACISSADVVRAAGAATRGCGRLAPGGAGAGGWRRRCRMGVPGRGRSVQTSRGPSSTRRWRRGRGCGVGRRATHAEAASTAAVADATLYGLYHLWWRVEAVGLERLPARGSAIVVVNRAPALVPYEPLVVAMALAGARPSGAVQPMVDPARPSGSRPRPAPPCRGRRPRCRRGHASPPRSVGLGRDGSGDRRAVRERRSAIVTGSRASAAPSPAWRSPRARPSSRLR
jgi:hypothetical protein